MRRIADGVRLRKTVLPGLCLALMAAAGAWAVQEPEADGKPDGGEPSPGRVVRIQVDSIIHPVAAQYITESLDYADEIRAAALVMELNTPGGLLDVTRDIFTAMASARTPVVVFVAPSGAQAASAGFFLLMAADVAAMAPGTNTGAAHPVGGQGEDIEGHMGEKIEQDSAATIRSLARQHGRNPEKAEAAVVDSRSYTAEEALAEGLIEFIAPTVGELMAAIDGREVEKVGSEPAALATAEAVIELREMPPFQRFLATIVHPQIALILMALGWIGLYMELSHPGAILPGVVGAICLILGFYALSVLPVNYAGVALILLALILFIAELKVVSYGLLSVGGVIALVLGSVMLFKDVEPALRVGGGLIAATSGSILIIVGLLMWKALSVRRQKVTTGVEGLVGERGQARTDVDLRGKVFIHGELWHARAEQPIAAGGEIEVTAVEGMTLRVRAPAAATTSP